MISLFVWGIIQMALVIYSSTNCHNDINPFVFICDMSFHDAAAYFYFPASLLLLMNVRPTTSYANLTSCVAQYLVAS
jgi:hypothetical protein